MYLLLPPAELANTISQPTLPVVANAGTLQPNCYAHWVTSIIILRHGIEFSGRVDLLNQVSLKVFTLHRTLSLARPLGPAALVRANHNLSTRNAVWLAEEYCVLSCMLIWWSQELQQLTMFSCCRRPANRTVAIRREKACSSSWHGWHCILQMLPDCRSTMHQILA